MHGPPRQLRRRPFQYFGDRPAATPKSTVHINHLAGEVLAHIFGSVDAPADNGTSLLAIARVCRQWKDVVFDHPQLWASLKCSLESINGPVVDGLRRWFARAGDLPLSLDVLFRAFDCNTGARFAQFIAGCLKWGSLGFTDRREGQSLEVSERWLWMLKILLAGESVCASRDGKPCWPLLRALRISSASVVYTQLSNFVLPLSTLAPGLQEFEASFLTVTTPLVLSSLKNFPFAHLSEFASDGLEEIVDPALLYHVLTHAPGLERLQLGCSRFGTHSPGASPQSALNENLPLTHGRLQKLSLQFPEHFIATICRNVRLPALRILKLRPSGVKRGTSGPLIAALNDGCRHPDFWPRLTSFSYGPNGVGGFLLREGDEGFESFKAAGPGTVQWVRERMISAGS